MKMKQALDNVLGILWREMSLLGQLNYKTKTSLIFSSDRRNKKRVRKSFGYSFSGNIHFKYNSTREGNIKMSGNNSSL
jgi:hypothetical protein